MGTKARILIVDDNKDLCLNLTDIFEDAGCSVKSVNAAGDAIEGVGRESFDLVLIDVKLPDMTGNELLHRLKQIRPDLAAIMITGHATTESAIQALNEGASAYILKPLEMEQVAAIVEQTIEKQVLRKRLQESEARNKSLFENTHDAIFILDAESGKIVEVNHRAEELTGYSKEELLNMNGVDLQIPEERSLIAGVLQGRSEYSGVFNEISILKKGESRLLADVGVTMVSSGHTKVIQANVRDVTEKKLLQNRLFETEKLLTIGRMAAGVAHQINNPLTGVMGFAQILLKGDLTPGVRNYLEKIYAAAERAAKVTQTMLSFARESKSERNYIDVNEVIRSVVELKHYDFASKGFQIVAEFSPEPSQIMGDFHQLQQAFLNIITNAEQAMEESGCGDTLTIRTEDITEEHGKAPSVREGLSQSVLESEQRGSTRVLFSDNGPGIPPEHLGRIFDPFFTTRDEGAGIGLGLSTCFTIIHEHGGSIIAESPKSGGARFIIELPFAGDVRKDAV